MFAGTPFSSTIGDFFVDNHLEGFVTWLGEQSFMIKNFLAHEIIFQDILIRVSIRSSML